MKLSFDEVKILASARARLIQALRVRSNYPAGFEVNIQYLKELQAVHLTLKAIISLHHSKIEMLNDSVYKKNLLDKLSARHLRKKEKQIVKEANHLLFDDNMSNIIEREFAEESRIKALELVFSVDDHLQYEILFADDARLSIDSLADKKQMKYAKLKFNKKMQSLQEKNRVLYRA